MRKEQSAVMWPDHWTERARSARIAPCLLAFFFLLGWLCGCPGSGPKKGEKAPAASRVKAAPSRGADSLGRVRGLPRAPFGKPRLEKIAGVPVVFLRGTPAQRGLALGRLLKQPIRRIIKKYLRGMVFPRLGGKEMALVVARAAEPMISAEVKDEMKGIAQGADVSYDDVLMLNAHVDALVVGCSTAVILPAAAADRGMITGRNLDWPAPRGMEKLAVLEVVRSEKGVSYANYTYPGFVGILTGINACGVSVAMNVSSSKDNSRSCVPTPLLLRDALERSKSASSLLSHVSRARRCSGFLITAADPRGASVLEVSAGKTGMRAPKKNLLLSTNHYRSKVMIPVQKGEPGRSTLDRLEALSKGLERWKGKGITVFDLISLFSSSPVHNKSTLMSVILSNTHKRVWLWEKGMTAGDYKKLDLEDYLTAR